ncbi:MAG: MATE family efflux transporter [Defluviitaleaceae bacterium]|nr:MATE family efflux transporter [Defluviitaleaceae bacterium]
MEVQMFSKRALKRLIVPLLFEQALSLTIGMIAMIMVSRLNEAAVSGVSLVESINILLFSLFSAFASGGAIIAGQYLGKGEPINARKAASQLVVVTSLIALGITILAVVFNHQILRLIYGNIEPDVMQSARTYFYMTALSFPAIAIYNVSAALFRAMGNARVTMVNAVIMNILNIAISAILIYGFGFGVLGAGIAVLSSRFIASASMTGMLRNKSLPIYVRKYSIKSIELSMIKRVLKIAVPSGVESSAFQLGKIIIARVISGLGTAAIAANAISNTMANISMIPGTAINLALITVVAQCIGASEYEQAKMYIKKLMKIAYTGMFAMNVLILIFAVQVVGIFNLSPEAGGIATNIVRMYSISAIFIWPLSFTLPNAFRASGDAKFPMTVSMLTMIFVRVGMSFFMVYVVGLGVFGVWVAMIIDWGVRSIFFVIRWQSGKWQKKALV